MAVENINNIADYIIFKLNSDEQFDLSNLKLQKLLYYTQAWYLAFEKTIFFKGKFQAWIHGPVNREIYDRFNTSKYLYSLIEKKDILNSEVTSFLSTGVTRHIDVILDAYAKYSATELEVMTHQEDPWIFARKGFLPTQRCEVNIDENLMRDYYSKRLEA